MQCPECGSTHIRQRILAAQQFTSLDLTEDQINAALSYIEANRSEVETGSQASRGKSTVLGRTQP